MARAAKTARTKARKVRVPSIALNPAKLTENEADYLCWLNRRHRKRIPLDAAMKRLGFRVAH